MNHFQKGVIVFVALMILTIPNLHIHSFIGSYQTSSSAITANNTYKYFLPKSEPTVLIIEQVALMGAVVVLIGLAVIGGTVAAAVLGVQKGSIAKNIDANYAKHDFSKFDNYTPSSMKPEF